MPDKVIRAIPTPVVCRLAGVSPSTLDYWINKGLIYPSIRGPKGQRVTRLWSAKDVVIIRSIKALRNAGCPLQVLRSVKKTLNDSTDESIRDQVLYWDGFDLLGLDNWGNLQSLRRRPRQQMLHVLAIPIGDWNREAELSLAPFSKVAPRIQMTRDETQQTGT